MTVRRSMATSSLIIETKRVGADTLLSQIVDMVANAQRSRAPIQKLADSVAGKFVPAVVGIAALAFIGWAVLGTDASAGVCVGVCGGGADHRLPPCALGWLHSMSIMVPPPPRRAAGVLIKNAGRWAPPSTS